MKKTTLLIGLLFIFLGFVFYFINTPYRYVIESNTSISSGKVARAITILEDGLKKYPDNSEILYLLAKSYLLVDAAEQASRIVLRKKLPGTLKTNKKYQNFLVDLSESMKRLGNEKLAEHFAEEYLKCQKQNEASKRVIKNYISIGQILPEKSIELWEKAYNVASAIKENELKEDLKALLLPKYFQLIESHNSQKEYNNSLEIVERAKALGKNAELSFKEAVIYANLGDLEKAKIKFENVLQLEPSNDSYKIAYADVLEKAARRSHDMVQQSEYFEKIKLVLSGVKDNKRKISLLNKIMNMNARYKISSASLTVTMVGDYLYPYLAFTVAQGSGHIPKNFKIEFYDANKNKLDTYEAQFSHAEFGNVIEVTAKNPVSDGASVKAKLFLDNEFVKEYSAK